ncbi:30S ribosomal protein S1 [Candidatus Gottesmanbacteria bacterium]|nr:30S ribosomal protein S1 [Candidatus Gottesmanbacteria bacterium]
MKIKIQNPKSKDQSDKSSVKSPKSHIEPETMDELLSQVGDVALSIKKGDKVEGTVVSTSPKEILVDIGKKSFGILAEWELEQVKDYAITLKVGDKIAAAIINPENDMGYTVLSVRSASTQRRWDILKEKQEKGDDLDVTGYEMAKGGLLVEWQGLRGFIPSTQFESNYATNPSVLIGRSIKVKILEIDKALNRIVLSQKAAALGITPTALKQKLAGIKTDDTLQGIISGIAPFGIFVDVDGIEGLVHISEIAWEKVGNPATLYKVGQGVEVLVLEVNQREGKLNLSIKRLTPDPWKNILDRYPLETTVKGKVTRVAPYGVFIQLEPGIEGLLHVSKITQGEDPKEGEEISCVIESIDEVKRKISLTLIPKEKPVGYR